MPDPAASALLEEWLPVGEEPHAPYNITGHTILRHNGLSALSLPNGDIDAARGDAESTGLYHRDTRYLSCLTLSFGRVAPMLLDAREVEGALSAIFTNPAIQARSDGRILPAQSLVLRRRRVVNDSLVESITVSNYSTASVSAELRVDFGADFSDIFEIRGFTRAGAPPFVETHVGEASVRFTSLGLDGRRRFSEIRFGTRPDLIDEHSATFRLALEPRQTLAIDIEVAVQDRIEGATFATLGVATAALERLRSSWLAEVTVFESDNDALDIVVRRALGDIQALWTRSGEGEYIAAGVPWFDTLFGRDSLITGIELLAWAPEALRVALRALARHQADSDDPVHDATPGKLPHELRWGELAAAGEVPFGRYYGSVDVTPLFVHAACEYYRWTGDGETIRELWPAIRRAVQWTRTHAAAGVNGFLSYSRVSARGLENQGWKDSHDGIVWPDGRRVDGPIALVEVQGYVAAALAAFANLAAVFGGANSAAAAREAAAFSERLDAAFGHEANGYVLCLDGFGAPVPTVASNAGHLLWCGAARPERAERVAARLFEPDSFSGWGIRTLASSVGRFNPLGYHTGSVWPHDNALILAGLRSYGFDDRAQLLASSLLAAAGSFTDLRVPELFSGDARDLRQVPTPYPVASRPQAWSAASVPYILSSMLGLRPGRPGQLAIVRPRLPEGVAWARLRNLRFADGSVALCFRRSGDRVAVEIESISGGIEVALAEQWPERAAPPGPRAAGAVARIASNWR